MGYKFKQGDKVVVDYTEEGDCFSVGDVGTVVEDSNYPFVEFVAGDRQCCSEDQLSLVEERVVTPQTELTSEYFLQKAIDLQKERGKEYDSGKERSMGKNVAVFNLITGHSLSEAEGWLFMQCLKDVRQWTKPEYHQDSAEDCVSYASLKAEALVNGR